MTNATHDPSTAPIDSVPSVDHLRDHRTVDVHVDREVVDTDRFETVQELPDMAPVGVVADDGTVLFTRIRADCDRKLPTPNVQPGDDYAAIARDWVRRQAGLEIELTAVEGIWRYEAEHPERDEVARRSFVVFRATVSDTAPEAGEAHDAGWYDAVPDDAVRVPGTDRFFA